MRHLMRVGIAAGREEVRQQYRGWYIPVKNMNWTKKSQEQSNVSRGNEKGMQINTNQLTGKIRINNAGFLEITPGNNISFGKLNNFLLSISYAVLTTLSMEEAKAPGLVALSLANASK